MEFFDLNFEEVQMLRSFIVSYLRSNRIKVPKKSWNAMQPEVSGTIPFLIWSKTHYTPIRRKLKYHAYKH